MYLDVKRSTRLSVRRRTTARWVGDVDVSRRCDRWRVRTASEPRARSRSGTSATRSTGCPRSPVTAWTSTAFPTRLKVLLENLLRTEDGADITADDIRALAGWDAEAEPDKEIQFTPARVIMQDFTGVPCIVDLATMREAMADLGGDADQDQPARPGRAGHRPLRDRRRLRHARGLRAQRRDRVRAQRGALPVPALGPGRVRRLQGRAARHRHRPPGQHRAPRARRVHPRGSTASETVAYPDTCVGTDSHTTMVNGIGVVGWGVGGIEAEAAMLGQPVSMLIPRVVGFKLSGELPEGATATDLVLTITEMLRQHGVVGKFVEFYGDGVGALPLANRATIGNMSPEFGSTIAVFPDRRRDHQLPPADRSPRRPARAGRGLRQGAGPLARPECRAALLRAPRARPVDRRTVAGRAEAAAGPRRGHQGGRVVRQGARGLHRPPRRHRDRQPRRAAGRDRPRRRRDRRHHVVHQHLQPERDDRRGAARQERRREGPDAQAVGQDHAGARLQGGHRLLRAVRASRRTSTSWASTSSATAARRASATPAR